MVGILKSPLPRIYEEGREGPVPSDDPQKLIGGDVQIDRIKESADEMGQRLENEICVPVRQWLLAYNNVQV
jgi:hypothetical protein